MSRMRSGSGCCARCCGAPVVTAGKLNSPRSRTRRDGSGLTGTAERRRSRSDDADSSTIQSERPMDGACWSTARPTAAGTALPPWHSPRGAAHSGMTGSGSAWRRLIPGRSRSARSATMRPALRKRTSASQTCRFRCGRCAPCRPFARTDASSRCRCSRHLRVKRAISGRRRTRRSTRGKRQQRPRQRPAKLPGASQRAAGGQRS